MKPTPASDQQPIARAHHMLCLWLGTLGGTLILLSAPLASGCLGDTEAELDKLYGKGVVLEAGHTYGYVSPEGSLVSTNFTESHKLRGWKGYEVITIVINGYCTTEAINPSVNRLSKEQALIEARRIAKGATFVTDEKRTLRDRFPKAGVFWRSTDGNFHAATGSDGGSLLVVATAKKLPPETTTFAKLEIGSTFYFLSDEKRAFLWLKISLDKGSNTVTKIVAPVVPASAVLKQRSIPAKGNGGDH
jgi:hypothetical protein